MVKSIEQTIRDVSEALQKGVHPKMAKVALLSDGWRVERATLILRWAQRISAQKKAI
jgi:hypothetical protein